MALLRAQRPLQRVFRLFIASNLKVAFGSPKASAAQKRVVR
jgi:hypothetical protein